MNSSTLIIVAGFAYMLQRAREIVEIKANGTNHAYLFSYESKLRDKYLGNLMELVLKLAIFPEDNWLKRQAVRYAERPIWKREEFFEICPQYFSVEKKIMSEESFDYSILTQEGRILGGDICREHFDFFQRLVKTVCEQQSTGNPESSCGIIFTSEE